MNKTKKSEYKNNESLVDDVLRRMLSTPPQNPKSKKKDKKEAK